MHQFLHCMFGLRVLCGGYRRSLYSVGSRTVAILRYTATVSLRIEWYSLRGMGPMNGGANRWEPAPDDTVLDGSF